MTLAFLTVAYVLPVYVVVVTSLKTPAEISAQRYLSQHEPRWRIYHPSADPSLINSTIIGFR